MIQDIINEMTDCETHVHIVKGSPAYKTILFVLYLAQQIKEMEVE